MRLNIFFFRCDFRFFIYIFFLGVGVNNGGWFVACVAAVFFIFLNLEEVLEFVVHAAGYECSMIQTLQVKVHQRYLFLVSYGKYVWSGT